MPHRVLIAWELGSNLGHRARCLALARALQIHGIETVLALRDLRGVPHGDAFRIIQAPRLNPARHDPHHPPANYAELLLAVGYADHEALRGGIRGWNDTIALSGADLVLADHAPTAMLAAALMNIPHLAIGNGFAIPPAITPWPSIRPWEQISADRLRDAETTLDLAVATAMSRGRNPAALNMRALFRPAHDLLDTFPEMDHYGVRPDSHYIGPIFGLGGEAASLAWQGSGGRKIAAYLRAGIPGFASLLDALAASDAEVLCVVPDLPPEMAQRWPRLRLSREPVRLDHLVQDMDLMIGYGGGGTMCEVLLAGVPLLLMPHHVEQVLASQCLQRYGAAHIIGRERSRDAIASALDHALNDPQLHIHANRFAREHAGYRSEDSIERAVRHLRQRLPAFAASSPASTSRSQESTTHHEHI